MDVGKNYSKIKLVLSKANGKTFYQIFLDEDYAGKFQLIKAGETELGKKINLVAHLENGFDTATVNGMALSQKITNLMNGHFTKKGESVLLFYELAKKEEETATQAEEQTQATSSAETSASATPTDNTNADAGVNGLPSSIEELTNELQKAIQTYTYPEAEPVKTTIVNDPIMTLDLVNIMTENRKPEADILRVGNTYLSTENQVDPTLKTKKPTDVDTGAESEHQS